MINIDSNQSLREPGAAAALMDLWESLWKLYPTQKASLPAFEKALSYEFRNRSLLYEALTHRSAVISINKNLVVSEKERSRYASLPWHERIEFLGDSVLGLVVSSQLWTLTDSVTGKLYTEGELSKLRSGLVNELELAELARSINLSAVILLGRAEHKSGGRERDALLADTLEALIGAVFLDGGYECAKKFVLKLFGSRFSELSRYSINDAKSALQEWSQNLFQEAPDYKLVSEQGPDHLKTFTMQVSIRSYILAQGHGQSKKKASQNAASQALRKLKDDIKFERQIIEQIK